MIYVGDGPEIVTCICRITELRHHRHLGLLKLRIGIPPRLKICKSCLWSTIRSIVRESVWSLKCIAKSGKAW